VNTLRDDPEFEWYAEPILKDDETDTRNSSGTTSVGYFPTKVTFTHL